MTAVSSFPPVFLPSVSSVLLPSSPPPHTLAEAFPLFSLVTHGCLLPPVNLRKRVQRRSMRNVRARQRKVFNTPHTLVMQAFGLEFLHIEPDRGERWSHDGGEFHSFTRSIQRHLPLLSPLHPWTSIPHPKLHCFRRQ